MRICFQRYKRLLIHFTCRTSTYIHKPIIEMQALNWDIFKEQQVHQIKYFYTTCRFSAFPMFSHRVTKWPSHLKYYKIDMYISHEQIHFAYTNTHWLFLSAASTIEIAPTFSSIAGTQKRLTSKMWNCFYSFPFSCQKVHSTTTSYDKLLR